MPKVGLKEFPYTPEGEGEAKIYAALTEQPVSKDPYGYGTEQGMQEGVNVEPCIDTEQLDDPRREGFSSKQKIDDLAQRYTQEYLEAGVDQDKAYWLSLIDIGLDPETKNVISEDPELQKMYQGLFKSTNINYLDVTHHRQSRSRLGLDSPHMGEADWRGKQEGGPVGDRFGYGTYQEGGEAEHPRQNIEHIQAAINASYEEDDKGPAPIAEKRGEHFVVKLDIENALDQAGYLEDYVFAGSDNIPNMVYEVNGKLHKYDYSLFGGPELVPVEGMQRGGPVGKFGY